jgi:hypothetical protein
MYGQMLPLLVCEAKHLRVDRWQKVDFWGQAAAQQEATRQGGCVGGPGSLCCSAQDLTCGRDLVELQYFS